MGYFWGALCNMLLSLVSVPLFAWILGVGFWLGVFRLVMALCRPSEQ